MARARGCDLRTVLAGAVICWAVAQGVAVAQEGGEVTEELGDSYLLARRTTGQGSIIETLLFAGRAIVTEIAVPAPEGGMAAGTTGAAARTLAGGANAAPGGAAALPANFGSGFGGTWLTGEIIGDHLVLHRIRATDPVTHEIFHEGRKVGSVTEVGPLMRTGRLAGRNSFAFESIGDRFIVHLIQPDGTRIRATTEHGRFLSQVVERSASLAAATPRFAVGVAAPLEPSLEAVGPSIGRSPEPQRLARPQEAAGSIIVEEPAPRVIVTSPETVPIPRPSPLPRTRPAMAAIPVRTAAQPPAGNSYRSAPGPITAAPAITPKPTITSVSAPVPAAVAAPRAAAPASAIAAPAATPKPAITSVNAAPPPAATAARSITPTNAAPTGGSKPAAAVATQPLAATSAKPIVRAPATVTPAAKPKPALATDNAPPPPSGAAKPVTPVARPSPPLSDTWLR